MSGPLWKTDWLYRLVFRKIAELWQSVSPPSAEPTATPDALRIEEHTSADWSRAPTEVWVFDEAGARLASFLRAEDYDHGELRENCWQFGLIQFHRRPDLRQVDMFLDLGPGQERTLVCDVVGDEETATLRTRSESPSASR
jgi:hypothetical protein